MATKTFSCDPIGAVHVTKRRSAQTIRLRITATGEVHVSIPSWVPYKTGIEFATSRIDWITKNKPKPCTPLLDGDLIGKHHRLSYVTESVDAPTSRITDSLIRVRKPHGMAPTHPAVQAAAQQACIRALRQQAESLLPARLRSLADAYGFSYQQVSIKKLTSRWGSCDQNHKIVLNLFLMQLPWSLVDYVLLHELVHTKHLNHSELFWRECVRHVPHAKALRYQLKARQPILYAIKPVDSAHIIT